MKRILVLYRELAGYFVACLNTLCDQYNVSADVVAYPVHADAPFQFEFSDRIRTFDRTALDTESMLAMIRDNRYQLIFCGGWSDKSYLQVIKQRGDVPALLGFDNQWNGSFKHHLATIYARWAITPLFDVAFVPGPGQHEFARRMGFRKIVSGAYSCDVHRFEKVYAERDSDFWGLPTKNLYFVGRYAQEKFILELQQAFLEANAESGSQWTLTCAGTGPLWDQRVIDPAIHHLGFMQPHALLESMKTAHAFVLPSTFEPWGVVVHEFAAAGLPMIISNEVGARHAFLEDGKNGFLHHAGSAKELKKALLDLMNSSNNEFVEMSRHSYYLAHKITPETWSASLVNLFKP